jgi:hypothetical protein
MVFNMLAAPRKQTREGLYRIAHHSCKKICRISLTSLTRLVCLERFWGGQPGYSPVATTWAAGFYPCPVCRMNRRRRYISKLERLSQL